MSKREIESSPSNGNDGNEKEMNEFSLSPNTLNIDPNTKSIFINGQIIWNEAKILYKIIYKSKNQHRRSNHYHKMVQASKSLKKLYQLDLFLSWNIPKRAQDPSSYRKIIGYMLESIKSINKCIQDCLQLFIANRILYDMMEFMPLAGVTLAIAARIKYFLLEYQIEMKTKLHTITKFLPQDQEESLLKEFNLKKETGFVSKRKKGKILSFPPNPSSSSTFTSDIQKPDEIDEIFHGIFTKK